MSDLEKIVLKSHLINTRFNIAVAQQNVMQYEASASILYALHLLLAKIDPNAVDQIDLIKTITSLTSQSKSVKESFETVKRDIIEYNTLLDSLTDDLTDLSKFKFPLN